MREEIDCQQVHLWYALVQEVSGVNLSQIYLAMLAHEERVRYMRFVFEKDRFQYLVARALVRVVLSKYTLIPPQDLTFKSNEYGRPYLTNDHPLARRICFNLSYTAGLVLLAVTTERIIGVDTENIAAKAPLEVAERYFSSAELAALVDLPRAAQARRFWNLWTFKESYIKARGVGLSHALDCFSFHFCNEKYVKIAFEDFVDDLPSNWLFWQFMPNSDYLFSLCLEQSKKGCVDFVCRRVVPLCSDFIEVATMTYSPA